MRRAIIVLSYLMLSDLRSLSWTRRRLDNMCRFDDWWLKDLGTGFEGWDYADHLIKVPTRDGAGLMSIAA